MWSERIRSRFTGQPPNRLISERRRARRARSDRRHQPATAHRQNEAGNPAVPNLSSPAALRTSPGRCGAGSTSLFRTPSGPSERRTAGRATDGTDERLQQNPKVGWGGVQFAWRVPTVADRIAQTAVKMWLEPRLDPIFHEDSYGYRPGKSALTAIAITRRRCWDSDWVVEFDIRGLFDNLDHGLLMSGSAQALPGALDPALRGTLAESADANHGRADSGTGQRHAARRCRVADPGQSVPALCI